ncbi:MAG: hypothetical protein JM58_01935 [Peptococcaceae bacterium BICA1-8]|nr:MAG: hypothetical protein JM58_01935 [Peptococcaceae bacterium BICA1-8]
MFGFLPNIGIAEISLILVLALIIFGPGKLPEVGKALGKSINQFMAAVKTTENNINEEVEKIEK